MITLSDEQKVTLTIDPRTASNNPANVENINWTNSDESVATLIVSEDKKSATVVSAGIGSCQISVVVDADLSENVKELSGFIDISVIPAMAATLGISAGIPELK